MRQEQGVRGRAFIMAATLMLAIAGAAHAQQAAIAVLPVPGYASMTLLLRFHDTP